MAHKCRLRTSKTMERDCEVCIHRFNEEEELYAHIDLPTHLIDWKRLSQDLEPWRKLIVVPNARRHDEHLTLQLNALARITACIASYTPSSTLLRGIKRAYDESFAHVMHGMQVSEENMNEAVRDVQAISSEFGKYVVDMYKSCPDTTLSDYIWELSQNDRMNVQYDNHAKEAPYHVVVYRSEGFPEMHITPMETRFLFALRSPLSIMFAYCLLENIGPEKHHLLVYHDHETHIALKGDLLYPNFLKDRTEVEDVIKEINSELLQRNFIRAMDLMFESFKEEEEDDFEDEFDPKATTTIH